MNRVGFLNNEVFLFYRFALNNFKTLNSAETSYGLGTKWNFLKNVSIEVLINLSTQLSSNNIITRLFYKD